MPEGNTNHGFELEERIAVHPQHVTVHNVTINASVYPETFTPQPRSLEVQLQNVDLDQHCEPVGVKTHSSLNNSAEVPDTEITVTDSMAPIHSVVISPGISGGDVEPCSDAVVNDSDVPCGHVGVRNDQSHFATELSTRTLSPVDPNGPVSNEKFHSNNSTQLDNAEASHTGDNGQNNSSQVSSASHFDGNSDNSHDVNPGGIHLANIRRRPASAEPILNDIRQEERSVQSDLDKGNAVCDSKPVQSCTTPV